MWRPTTVSTRAWGMVAISALALVLSLSISACGQRAALFADSRPEPAEPAPRVQVLQGDVMVVDGQHIHLADTTAPQPTPDARCIAEAVAARQARLRLQQLALGVHRVEVSPTGARDHADRAEARVRFDGQDPGQQLIDEGLAVATRGAPFDWCGPVSKALPRGNHIAMLSLSGS
jgi:endonuclease YncB( thermonuclease family)